MRIALMTMLALTLTLGLVLPAADAQVTLESPANRADLSSPPSFSWSGPYDSWLFLSMFYYDFPGVFTGYYPNWFWLSPEGFNMQTRWLDALGLEEPHYWLVFGYDSTTGQGAFSQLRAFTKVP
jgi:hypothetical protein